MNDALALMGWSVVAAMMLALVVWGLCRTRWLQQRPALRHALWLLVLAKLVVPSLVSVAVLPAETARMADEVPFTTLPSADDASPEEPAVVQVQPDNLAMKKPEVPERAATSGSWLTATTRMLSDFGARGWILILLATSGAVSCVLAAAAIRRCRQIHQLISANAAQSTRATTHLREVSAQFHLKHAPAVWIVNTEVAPMLWAAPHGAIIVLPRVLFDSLTDDQARSVIAHELAHYVRRDHWAHTFAFCVTTLAWWNPVAWLARRELAEAAEVSCDALVVERLPGSRKCYAQTLLSVVDFLTTGISRPAELAINFGESRSLRRRFETLADLRVTPRVSRIGWMLLILAAAVSMLVPVRAQQQAAEPVTPPEASAEKEAAKESPAASAEPDASKDPSAAPPAASSTKEKTQQAIKGIGIATDPDDDCQFHAADGGLTIVIPKTWHDLTYTENYAKLNAPRVLQEVEGDFFLQGKVKAFQFPAATSSSGGDYAFVSAGLLIWQDEKNFVRVDRASVGDPFVWVEWFKDGKSASQDQHEIKNADSYLRATRTGGTLSVESSENGIDWTPISVGKTDLADKLQVGFSAINTTDAEFTATFEDLKLARSEPPKEDAKATWPLRVQVVDEATGEPIAGPRVSLDLGKDKTSYEGDSRGEVLLRLPSRTPAYCYLRARAPGYAPVRAFWSNREGQSADELPESYTLQMRKAITVGGRVVDEQGNPVADASVVFSAGDNAALTGSRTEASFFDEEYTTDADGRWECDLAPPDMKGGSIRVNHPDFARVTGHWSVDDKLDELRAGTYEFTLQRGFAVRGRVTDPDGKPVAGAVLAVGHANWYDDAGHFPQTDAEGRYEFTRVGASPGWPAGSDPKLTITAIKPGLAPMMKAIKVWFLNPDPQVAYHDREIDFALKPGRTVRIRVVDGAGEGIPGATVLPNEWNETRPFLVLAKHGVPRKANKEGVWEWTWAPPDDAIEYDIQSRGFMDSRDQTHSATQDVNEITVTLKRPQVISGRVIDATTGQPIDSFLVQKGFEGFNAKPDGVYWDTSQDTRGRDGKYSKTITLPPQTGSYRYRALAEGYEPKMSPSVKFDEGTVTVDFELTPLAAGK